MPEKQDSRILQSLKNLQSHINIPVRIGTTSPKMYHSHMISLRLQSVRAVPMI